MKKCLIIVLLIALLPNLSQAQVEGGYMGKKMALDAGIGFMPFRSNSFVYALNLVEDNKLLGFRPVIKVNFGYALNRRDEIGLSFQRASYNMVFGEIDYNGEDWFQDSDFVLEGERIEEVEFGDLSVQKDVIVTSIGVNYKYYIGRTIAPIGNYVKFGLSSVKMKVKDGEGTGLEMVNTEAPIELFELVDEASAVKFSVGYNYKMGIGDGFYFLAGVESNIYFKGKTKPDTQGTSYKSNYYYDQETMEDYYLPYNMGRQAALFEYINFDFGFGMVF